MTYGFNHVVECPRYGSQRCGPAPFLLTQTRAHDLLLFTFSFRLKRVDSRQRNWARRH